MKSKYIPILLAAGLFSALITVQLVKDKDYEVHMKGKLAVVNKGSSSVTIVDLEKGTKLAELPIEVEPHEIVSLEGDELVVVSNYGNERKRGSSLTVINTTSNKIERTIDLGDNLMPHGIIAVPHTNNVIVAAEGSNALLVVNAMTGVIEKKVSTNQKQSHMAALHPNNRIAYISNIGSNSISIIDIEKGELLQNIICGKGAVGIDVTPDGKEIWVSNSIENTVTVIDAFSYKTLVTLKCNEEPNRLRITPDGKNCLVANSSGGNISVFDITAKKLIHTIVVPGKSNLAEKVLLHSPRLAGIAFHPADKYVFVANSNANKVVVIDMESWKIVSNIEVGDIPDGMAVTQINSQKGN
jgi:YVTN family beta-propeller protein